MIPLVWMVSTALKSKEAANTIPPQWIPKEQAKVEIDGQDVPISTTSRSTADAPPGAAGQEGRDRHFRQPRQPGRAVPAAT